MTIAEKIAPAAGNLKDQVQAAKEQVQAAVLPYTGSLTDDDTTDSTMPESKLGSSANGGWLTGPALQGKSVQLHCRDACLPLCSSIQSMNPNNTLPCWADTTHTVIFGKDVGTLGTASLLALILVLASALGFIGGQKVDMKRVRERVRPEVERVRNSLPSPQTLKERVPDMNNIREGTTATVASARSYMEGGVEKLKQNAAALTGKKNEVEGSLRQEMEDRAAQANLRREMEIQRHEGEVLKQE